MVDLKFKKLVITDKDLLDYMFKDHPPYSDHHFTGLWTYNINDDIEIGILNDNLIIKSFSYDNDRKPLLTFFGDKNVVNTIETLETYARENGMDTTLHFVPEMAIKDVLDDLSLKGYVIEEDRDNFDYVVSIDKMVLLSGNKMFKHKRLIKKFLEEHGNYEIRELDLNDRDIVIDMDRIFLHWATLRNKKEHEYIVEKTALQRAIKYNNHFNFITVGLYLHEKLIGYVINERLDNGYYMGHFIKVDPSYIGIYQILEHESAKIMQQKGCRYMNNEQDLGDPNLRQAKSLWYPDFFLKKYKIYKKDNL